MSARPVHRPGASGLSRRGFVTGTLGAGLGASVWGTTALGSGPARAAEQAIGPVNGGFEEAVVDGVIPGWSQSYGGGGAGSLSVVETHAFEGQASLQIHDPDSDQAYGLLSDAMPVTAGEDYELTLRVRLPESTEPNDTIHGKAYLYFYAESGSRVGSSSAHFRDLPHGEWASVRLGATAPEQATTVSVLLYATPADSSTFYIDDVRLKHNPPLEITDLGVAMYTANVRLGRADVLPDGSAVAYVFNNGEPLSLNVVDLNSGEVLEVHEVSGSRVISTAAIGDDHMLYFSGRSPDPGALWRYDPFSREVEQLAAAPAGETAVNDLLVDGGTVYGSTYPNAKVWAYDTLTGDLRDYGQVTDLGSYARKMTMVDGDLWIGTSTSPELLRMDTETGERTELPLPPDMVGTADFFSELTTHEDLVLARYSPSDEASGAIYDLSAGEWYGQLDTGWWTYTTVDGAFFYAEANTVRAFDIATRQSRSIGWEDSALAEEYGGTARINVVDLSIDGFPGSTLVGFRDDGSIWRFNLQTAHGDILTPDIDGAPAKVQSVGHGADGNIYFGAYLSSGVISRIVVDTGELEQLSGPSQADSIVGHHNQTVVGTYPGAGFYAGHRNKTWQWGTNPSHLFSVGRDNGQDRAATMVAAGPRVAAGTIPNFGELGGALVLVNPNSGKYDIYRNIVPDQSVTALAYQDGIVYGGTGIYGGLDSEPTAETAELFAWDTRRDRLVTRNAVVAGAEIIHALAFDSVGRLWGMGDEGTLFQCDVRTLQAVRNLDTGIRNANIWGRLSELYQHPVDGLMYGNAGGRLFRFDPEQPDFTVLGPGGVRYSAVDAKGVIYFANDTNVFRWLP
ncbi:hypothetical protein [Ruania zhangjianzhongii]|uniref:hypothetical protein n=1 Tax=Ruania zhangjianzhongii TaxID=2603206 RepID=UPI0011C8058B|nr:hypothetical protein [Ruania zhangjianzhongii]